ncbi:MAG: hypothetical protein IJ639_01975, partial [Ruminococcus sp.]|nr:hypothetical protein [Ruminococcus sp.]
MKNSYRRPSGRLFYTQLIRTTLHGNDKAIVLIFILWLAAACFTLHLSPRAQDIFDAIFTIPMVLPPTVCGFVLL